MSVNQSSRTQVLDVRGYSCPYPQYYTIKALHSLGADKTLEILLDNQPSLEIVQDYARKQGCRSVSAEKTEDNTWKIVIRK